MPRYRASSRFIGVRRIPPSLPFADVLLAGSATHAWDFITNRSRFSGKDRGPLSATPNWTFTRASTGYAQTSGGVLVPFASGELRRTDKGVLIEGAATNLFLNSTAPVTQDINFASTGNRTLSVWGSGSVAVAQNSATITGAGTATQGSPITFNVTATGTCTFTVTGSPTIVQVETGAFATSPIVTAGASATRAADSLTVTGVTGLAYPLTIYCECELSSDAAGNQPAIWIDNGSGNTDLANLAAQMSTKKLRSTITASSAAQADISSTASSLAVGSVFKGALRVATNDAQQGLNGALATADTSVTLPSSPTILRFGINNTPGYLYGYLRRLAIFSRALSDGEIQALTT